METITVLDRDLECETLLRWDRTGEPAILWTADAGESRRWARLGYPVEVSSTRHGKPSGWRCRVPIEAIALLPLKAGVVQVSRYLSAPTVRTAPGKAQDPRAAKKTDGIPQENDAILSGAGEVSVS